MLFDPPIASGANTFIWIVVILIAFVGAISQHDALFKGKKKKGGGHPPCGTSGKKRGYAKCVPAAKAATMSKKEKESATRRKRAAQNKANRGGKASRGQGKKPINVSTHTGGRKSGTGKGS